jgi:hypothetical protein
MVMERLYESSVDSIPDSANMMNAITYKLAHTPDFSLVRYSLSHFADFIRGFNTIIEFLANEKLPTTLSLLLGRAKDLLNHQILNKLAATDPGKKLSAKETVLFGNHILYRFKSQAHELINIYGRLERGMLWHFNVHHKMVFPKFVLQTTPILTPRIISHSFAQSCSL